MKKLSVLFAALIIALQARGAEAAKECTLCVGAVMQESAPATAVPLLVRAADADLAAAAASLDSLTPEQRRRTVLLLTVALDGGLTEAETKAKSIVEWARLRGPLDTLALDVRHDDPAILAYALKRIAVMSQGLDVASRFGIAGIPVASLAPIYEQGANPYFDAVLVPAGEVPAAAAFLAERDPSKKIFAVVKAEAPNPMFDAARALADGAVRAYLEGGADTAAIANINLAFAGDWAYDSTAKTTLLDTKGNALEMPAVTFVRGEDLRTLIVPRGDAAAPVVLSLAADQFAQPHRVDASGERAITDSATRGRQLLVAVMPAATQPYLLYVNRAEKIDANVTKEAIDVATQRGITVEEIIRNHQAYDAYQESIQPKYIARNTTKLRFFIGDGGDVVEASISGDYYSDPSGKADWVWQDLHINGVKWKYGRIPELPLIQPEKVTQLPLDIHLTNEYRYQLVRETDLLGYKTYEVRFEPPPNAPAELPLYRGTVWIDARTWARVRISMIQLNLQGEVLSNEERVDFQPFARETWTPLSAAEVNARDGKSVAWLPREVSAQQVISAAGRANPIERATAFEDFRIEPADFDTRLQQVASSDARMVRETEAGLRYLEKRGNERVVKEGFDTSQIFALGGVHHDAGLEYPVVPLGGVDYFNFDLLDRGIQTNVFFAGVIVAANATHPNVANTRTNVGADFFGMAIAAENTMYRDGEERPEEAVKQVPLVLTLRAGRPIFNFGKIDVSFTGAHLTYQRGEETAAGFAVPSDTFLFGPSLSFKYARRGWAASAFYDYTARSTWEPWGNLAEFDEDQKTFTKFGASFGKSFFLPKFQRVGIDLNYLDGQRLDRFSKYELGFFGAQRVHGIKSGSVRAERGFIGHLSYGFVFSDQFRLEAFYDHAILDDTSAGLRREPFQGIGIAGQTVGPYGTLLRLDIGKTIGRNKQDGFVANVVFLKLF